MRQLLPSYVTVEAEPWAANSLRSMARANRRPRYLSLLSSGLFAALVFVNTSLSYEYASPPRDNLGLQLAVIGLFCLVWFPVVGARLSNAVFAMVALGPAVLVEGYGYLFVSVAALTLTDAMGLITVFFWIQSNRRLRLGCYCQLALALFAVCAVSVALTLNSAFLGSIIRLALAVLLVLIVFSGSGHELKRAFVDGMLMWPVTALAYLGGVGSLIRFVTFGSGAVLNVNTTGEVEVLYGSHQVVMYLLFMVPLALFAERKWAAGPLLLALVPYAIFSYSRSLIFAFSVAALTFAAVNIRRKRSFLAVFVIILLMGGMAAGVSQLGFFSWSKDGSKGASNFVRYAKMANALNTYLGSPVLGIGFGAVGAIDSKGGENLMYTDPRFFDLIIDKKASAEFTPLQILAETGTLGGVLSLLLLFYATRRLLITLRSPGVPHYVKAALYGWIVVFVTVFVTGNAYGSMILMLAIPVAASLAYGGRTTSRRLLS